MNLGLHDLYPRVGYWNALLWLGFFLFTVAIMGELKTLYLRERQLSRVDDLTRVPNRLAFYELATAEKNRAHRYPHPITLAYVDGDDFKGINDSLGHGAGDKLLNTVAQTMWSNIRLTHNSMHQHLSSAPEYEGRDTTSHSNRNCGTLLPGGGRSWT